MKKTAIILLVSLLLAAIFFAFFMSKTMYSNAVFASDDYHILTKAICNSSNFCQDHEIICKDSTVISSSPVTGAVIQHSPGWKDPRKNGSTPCS